MECIKKFTDIERAHLAGILDMAVWNIDYLERGTFSWSITLGKAQSLDVMEYLFKSFDVPRCVLKQQRCEINQFNGEKIFVTKEYSYFEVDSVKAIERVINVVGAYLVLKKSQCELFKRYLATARDRNRDIWKIGHPMPNTLREERLKIIQELKELKKTY